MQESITKAAQTVSLAVADLKEAHAAVIAIQRPEGRSLADKALAAYLADCLEAARELESKLAAID